MQNQPPFDPAAAMALLETHTVSTSHDLTHEGTAKKNYKNILRNINVTSFSQLDTFNRCPRKFQLAKANAAFNLDYIDRSISNVDFAFGHCVGAGIQHYLATGDRDASLLNAFLAWRAPFDAEIPKKGKSIWEGLLAVEIFIEQVANETLSDWELLILPNGKPAIEVGVSFHCADGFKHYGHLDIVLVNKRTGILMVVDCKTTGFTSIEESVYANSSQALSYAIMLQAAIGKQLVSYDVMYLVYSSTEREWTPLLFSKSVSDQAEFVKDLMLTQDLISTYNDVGFFPKRGNACFEYWRRCEYYGVCNVVPEGKLPLLATEEEAEEVDFRISLADVVASLKLTRKTKETNESN